MTQAAQTSTKPRGKRWIIIAGGTAVAAILTVVAVIVVKNRASRAPAPTADPVSVAKYVASPEFAQLPLEQRKPYLRELRSQTKELVEAAKAGKITREERTAALRNAISAGARIEMANYFALPAGPERVALLDRLIDEQERMREYAAQRPQESTQSASHAMAQMKQFAESLPPAERIKMAEFGLAFFNRRAERGLPMWPYGIEGQ